jgi:hypothetical protein
MELALNKMALRFADQRLVYVDSQIFQLSKARQLLVNEVAHLEGQIKDRQTKPDSGTPPDGPPTIPGNSIYGTKRAAG